MEKVRWALRTAFRFETLVDRKQYFVLGVVFMVLKYAGEVLIFKSFTDSWLTPLAFLNPLLSMRVPSGHEGSSRALWTYAAWSLPFVWIGMSLSIRRLLDAGRSPAFSFFFFVPILNYVLMLALSMLGSSPQREHVERSRVSRAASFKHTMVAALLAAVGGTVVIVILVQVFRQYGGSLFMGLPFVYGFVFSGLYNRGGRRPFGYVLAGLIVSLLVAGGLLLLFALEGAICIAMAAPLVIALAIFGAVLEEKIFSRWTSPSPSSPHLMSLFLLPLIAQPFVQLRDRAVEERPAREVLSVIEIDAPPEKVWEHVVSFSELPPPTELMFKLGIAHPLRAVIDGRGVGAVRRCQFSTGDFVEPITVWEQPSRLGFSVQFQPHSIKELSPYDQIHAPHLDGFMISERGEFRLIALPGGRTRLEGRTWYRMKIHPFAYWETYADYFIHQIHLRVLRHIASETSAG